MSDAYAWWQNALAGIVGPIHDEPVCGYFKVRDRRGENRDLAPIKRPWIACAIWREGDEVCAELGGQRVSVEAVWPYCAKNPIPFETYEHWHASGAWPSEAA